MVWRLALLRMAGEEAPLLLAQFTSGMTFFPFKIVMYLLRDSSRSNDRYVSSGARSVFLS